MSLRGRERTIRSSEPRGRRCASTSAHRADLLPLLHLTRLEPASKASEPQTCLTSSSRSASTIHRRFHRLARPLSVILPTSHETDGCRPPTSTARTWLTLEHDVCRNMQYKHLGPTGLLVSVFVPTSSSSTSRSGADNRSTGSRTAAGSPSVVSHIDVNLRSCL